MNEYAVYTESDKRDARRNSNFTVENLVRSGMSEENARKVLTQSMSKVQLMTELGVNQASVSYVYCQYITMEKLMDILDVDVEYATMVIETFNLVELFQKYGLNQNGVTKKGKSKYSFEGYHSTGFGTLSKKTVTGCLDFADDINNFNMSFVFVGNSSTLSIDYKEGRLCISYKYNDNYISGFDTTVEIDSKISLPISEGKITSTYKETKPIGFSRTSVTREISLDNKIFLKLLKNLEKLDEFIYAYDGDKLDEYFESSCSDNKVLDKTYYFQAD